MWDFLKTVFDYLSSIDLWSIMLRIALALVMGGIIGMERGKQGRAAGMRTHILVCLGATLTAMTGEFAFGIFEVGDPLRVSAQVISGIGFLGVGTILVKGRFQITGLTTAAGLWAAATIGIALGVRFYVGAIVMFMATVITMTFLHRFESRLTHKNTRFGIYVEIGSTKDIRTIIDHLGATYRTSDVQVTPPRSGTAGNVGIEAIIHAWGTPDVTPQSVIEALEKREDVIFSIESI